jgi:deoxyribonuclease I
MQLKFLALLTLTAQLGFAQTLLPADQIRFSPESLSLGEIPLGASEAGTWLCNDSEIDLEISLQTLGQRLQPSQYEGLFVNANDSLWIDIEVSGSTDLDLHEVMIATGSNVTGLPLFELTAQPRLTDNRWDSAANLWGSALVTELEDIVDGHTSYSYSSARGHMFGNYDNEDGRVQCVYTGEWLTTSGTPDHTVMNCEHTWPQSMGADGDAKSDMHHLFPTMSPSNSARGNLPFGVVVNENWSQGGSLRGDDASGVDVFEPRDVHKGDCARAMFYFALRWGNRENFLNYQEETLRTWCDEDPVSLKELTRNQAIESLQHNMSPLVENPAWLDRFASLSGNQTPSPTRELQLPATQLTLLSEVGEEVTARIPLLNLGNSPLLIGYVQVSPSDSEEFFVLDAPTSIPAMSLAWVEVSYETSGENGDALLRISSNSDAGFINEINLLGRNATTSIEAPHAQPQRSELLNAFPNPFNPTTQIQFNLAQASFVQLSIYDLQGRQVRELLQADLAAGKHSQMFDAKGLASGLYFTRLFVEGEFAGTQRLLLLK